MNRRNFFGAMVVASAALVVGQSATTRYVQFSPPREAPNIYYVHGHDTDLLISFNRVTVVQIPASQVKQGYGTFKLKGIGIYLSDTPQPNFEPITYWIPADHIAKGAAL